MHGHMIVCGEDALAMRIAEELRDAGLTVVPLYAAADLVACDITTATAVVCAGPDDAANLEISLLARRLNPEVRVVARLGNGVLREAMAVGNGPGAVLDVADLAAPSVVEACLRRTTHSITVAGTEFVVAGVDAPRDASLRDIFGDLAPVAVVHGEKSLTPGDVVTCPGRDYRVRRGDWTAMIGTVDEFAAQGISTEAQSARPNQRRSPAVRILDGVRAFRDDINPNFFRALAVSLTLLLSATVLLRFTYQRPGMGIIDALYFSTETIATVGYGDFSFVNQPTWLRLFGIVLMFAGVTTTAVLMAFVADLLLSRRLGRSSGRRKVRDLHRHIIVVGLGSFGVRVAADLKAAGRDVAVIESNEANRYLSTAADLDIPVIFGDATLRRTLEDARIGEASAVAILTQDDVVNIETGIVLREIQPGIPLILRIFDLALGAAVADRFRFENVRSTVELAAPWFIGAAMGLQVFGTFSVGQRSFMVGGVRVEPGSDLDGMRMVDSSTETRVIAIARDAADLVLHPRRDARLHAGDTAYLVGPYRELLDTLRKGQRAAQPSDRAVTTESPDPTH